MKEKFKIKKAQAGVDNTYVRKPYSLLELEKNKKKQIEEEYKKKQTQLKPKKENKINRDFYEKENQSREANDNINRRQQQTNTLGLALSPIPVLGEIYNTANTIANGIVDVAQGEYADAVMGAIPFKLSKKLNPNQDLITPSYGKNFTKNSVFDSDNFKSEIDWGKWNPDTPKYPKLINEYNTIEESTKKAGTWLKNSDGSFFQGTPEQFVQQQSSYFKKAFPDYYGEIVNHNSPNKFAEFKNNFFGTTSDRGWYGEGVYAHPNEKYTQEYGINNYKLYVNSKNKGFINKDNYAASKSYYRDYNRELKNLEKNKELEIKAIYENPKDYEDVEFWKNVIENKYNRNKKRLIEEQQEGLKHNVNQYSTLTNPQNGEVIIPFNNPVKSAVGNVGFFDITNPNIYKGIIPIGVAAGISQQKQFGGEANMEQDVVSAYIQQAGLDQTQAQQLMQELQALDETQLQQVLGKMQQQLQSAPMQQAPQQAPQQHQMSDGSVMEGAKHEQEQYMQAQYGKGIENSPNFRVANGLPIHESMGDVWDYIDEPHKAAMKLLGGNGYENYSDIVERKIKNNPEHFAHNWNPSVLNAIGLAGNIVLDPINYIPISKGIAGIKTMNGIYYTQKAKDINSAVKTLNGTRKVAKGWSTGDDIKDTYSTIIRNQYGGYEKWKKALPKNLQSTDTTLYNLRGAYEGGLIPEMTEDGLYHLGSRNPKTGELLKSPKHPTFNKMIEGEAQAGYEVYEKNGKLYSRPKSKQQYGGIPVDEDGVFSTGKNPVVVPTRGTGKISMESVDFPISAYDADTMEYLDMMYPDQEYQFDGVDNVLEIPQAKFGIQRMQTGGNIAMDNNRLMEYEYELNEDESPLGKKYQKKLDESYDALMADKLNVKEYFKQKEKLTQEYLANKYKNDKPVNYLNSPKKFPVKVRDFKSTPASNPTSTISTPNYSGNTPVEAVGNPNLRVGDRVDTVGGTPVRDFGISNKTDKFGFVSQLKGEKTSKQDNINDYQTWVKDWSTKIDGFDKLPYANQQMVAMQWVKAQRPDVYEGLRKQWEAKGYNKNGKGFEGFLNDGLYANITSSLRPSLLNDRVAPIAPIERKPTGLNTKIPTTLPLADIQKKVSVPTIEDDSINPADAIIGKLDNRDMSGRYLSNMKLRNNEIKLPYFGQVDLKTPQLYQQDITPYINNLYTGYNAAVQNIDMNSAVGQAQALQLNANLDKSINDVSGSVYNQNLKAAIDWENQLTGIYNQQAQMDNQNRAAYSDGVDLVRTNKQNVDNQIDALAYEHKMKQIQNQNKMVLSTLLHPDFYTTDEGNGQMLLKRKYNKAPTSTAKVAKFGMKKKAC